MVLDTVTLRIAFALMAMVLGLLFYFSAYRYTRSPYSGWWCLALVFFLTGSAAFRSMRRNQAKRAMTTTRRARFFMERRPMTDPPSTSVSITSVTAAVSVAAPR